jgi:hypothetical protein
MLLRFFFVSKRSKGALRAKGQLAANMREGTDIPFGDIEDSLKFELTLDREVLDGKVVLPVVGQALVESTVLVVRDVLRVTSPDGFRLVELLVGRLLLFDLLRLLLLGLVIFVLDLLDLRLLALFGWLLSLSLIVLDFL